MASAISTFLFALTTFVSAFLLFQVQPIIAKAILPWFGGNPSVWTTCMLFFQVALLLGYGYSHLLVSNLSLKWQGRTHSLLLLTAFLFISIIPERPPAELSENPTLTILLLLVKYIGFPYLLLSTTAPLVQAWFGRTRPGSSPYRLYSLSNTGSLLALLSYPFVFEPIWSVSEQGTFWGWGFVTFLFVGVSLALFVSTQPDLVKADEGTESDEESPPLWKQSLWFCLPMCGSLLLLAITNHICADVAVIPFLWVLPLSLYLLTFILCFESDRWFSFRVALPVLGVMMLFMCDPHLSGYKAHPSIAVTVSCAALFSGCMVCHGVAAQLKPGTKYLTRFHLMLSAGGAAGGVFVGAIAPYIFNWFYELPLSLILTGFFSLLALYKLRPESFESSWSRHIVSLSFIGITFLLVNHTYQSSFSSLERTRNFYGVLRLTEEDRDDPEMYRYTQYHGKTMHGFQLQRDDLRSTPTAYFIPESGVGRILSLTEKRAEEKEAGRKIAVLGLGAGALAVYAREKDHLKYYEINPHVVAQAMNDFTYVREAPGTYEVVLGDGRLMLEKEEPNEFDVFVMDAFSGDSIPTHLITAEAFELYLKHLKDDGVIAINMTTPFNMPAVVFAHTEKHGLHAGVIRTDAIGEKYGRPSRFFVATKDKELFEELKEQGNIVTREEFASPLVEWTDSFSNLFAVLKW